MNIVTKTSGDIRRRTKKLKVAIPRAAIRATNKALPIVRREATKKVANEINLPLKYVRKRFDVQGGAKGDRARIIKATKAASSGHISVYMRGLPVFQVAGAQVGKGKRATRRGVKAKGGRFYAGAFKVPSGHVFKRRTSGGLMMPKIGLRKRLRAAIKKEMKTSGHVAFRKEYHRQLRRVA